MNQISKKILLLLVAGDALTYAYHPGQKWRAIKNLSRGWKKISENDLKQGIRSLYKLDIIRPTA